MPEVEIRVTLVTAPDQRRARLEPSVVVACESLLFLIVFLAAASNASAEFAQVGLDSRPPTTTCIAPARPVADTSGSIVRVYPSIQFNFPDLPSFGGAAVTASMLPNSDSHWYVGVRAGRIIRFVDDPSTTSMETVLDISDRVEFGAGQTGVASLVFHPDFANKPYMYVSYSRLSNPTASYVSRFTSSDGGVTFDPATEEPLVVIEQNGVWHLVGPLAFGPDGYLYIATGDGTIPLAVNTAQDPNDLLGKLLRIDVDSASPYGIPPDNPFAGGGGAPEVFALGFRNPWRFSIDMTTGDIWLGDVGNHNYEEVNRIEMGGNYGWPVMEGPNCFVPGCDDTGKTDAVLNMFHGPNNEFATAVIGGYVYRGNALPDLRGVYIFSDMVPGDNSTAGIFYDGDGAAFPQQVAAYPFQPTSFAQDNDGELYILRNALNGQSMMHKLVPGAGGPPPSAPFPQKLSETGCVAVDDVHALGQGMIPYDLNAPLWSDGADKDRQMALPDGTQIDVDASGEWYFPPGSVLVKRFSYQGVPIETRLLVHHDDGIWAGYSYEWDADLQDATLLPAGKTKAITPEFDWTYPSRSQCMQCHSGEPGFVLGPENAQMNRMHTYESTARTANQIATLDHIDLFAEELPVAPADILTLSPYSGGVAHVTRRARSYLQANCSFCHRPNSVAPVNIDLRFTTAVADMSVCQEAPLDGNLGIPGAVILDPGSPATSILSVRMHALSVSRMPRIGSAVADPTGTALVDAWIQQVNVCDALPDGDGDATPDLLDNCQALSNPDQRDSDSDGYGNLCDADFNNDGFVNVVDLSFFKLRFFSADPDADLSGDGIVNVIDLGHFKKSIFLPPGPSGLVN